MPAQLRLERRESSPSHLCVVGLRTQDVRRQMHHCNGLCDVFVAIAMLVPGVTVVIMMLDLCDLFLALAKLVLVCALLGAVRASRLLIVEFYGVTQAWLYWTYR